MSDKPKDVNDPENKEKDAGQPGAVTGKGWDILVGGKENPYAAGGPDPFDIHASPATASTPDVRAKDAETDAILKSGASQPAQAAASTPPDAFLDKGRGAEMPRDLGPEELTTPGVSAGVVVAPVGPAAAAPGPVEITEVSPAPAAPAGSTGITEVSQPAAPAPSPAMAAPLSTGAPSGSGITEVAAPPGMPLPGAPRVSMPAPRFTPSAGPAAPVPFVPGLSISPGRFGSQQGINDPFATQADVVLNIDQPDLPPNPELEKMLLTPQRINALWDEINLVYDLVVNDVRGHFNTTEDAIAELRKARELLLAGVENYDNAEELVNSVKARLRLEEKVRQWAGGRGTWLAAYLILWFLVLSLATIETPVISTISTKLAIPEFLASTWLPTVFGTFGGVIGALWVLNKHITKKRDFDPMHTMWYVTNPFLGGALGIVTYMIVRGGGLLVATAGGSADFKLTPLATVALIALCVVVGFNQNVLWSLVDRFLKTVIPETQSDQVAATDTSPSDGDSSSAAAPSGPGADAGSSGAAPAGG